MKLDHIIIGMGRCGTTSLSEYIKQHPNINCSSVKEVHYFSIEKLFERGDSYLAEHFNNRSGITSMADTYLLLSKEGPARIHAHNPNIKITVLLREPTSRAYSNYHYSINNGYERKDVTFLETFQNESDYSEEGIILRNNLCHFEGSLYFKQLSFWLNYFKPDQLLILKTQDLKDDPQLTMNKFFDFLEVDRFKVRILEAQNIAKKVRSKSIQQFLLNRNHWLRKTVRAPLKIKWIKGAIIKSGVNDKLHQFNAKKGEGYRPILEEEAKFCADYFEEDLRLLKETFGISL